MVEKVVQVHCQTEDVESMRRLVRSTVAPQIRRYNTEMLRQSCNVSLEDLGRAGETV